MNYTNQVLTSLPFSHLIGSPLTAAIEAQSLAAKATVDFINAVGFKQASTEDPMFGTGKNSDVGEVRNIVFKYSSTNPDGSAKEATLTVPILSILPIPYIRIESMNIDFTANISETIEYATTSNSALSAEGSVGAKFLFWSPIKVALKGSISSNKTTSNTSKYKTEYTMGIHVSAVQDAMPSGLSKILNILENSAIQNTVISDASLMVYSAIPITGDVTLKQGDTLIATATKVDVFYEFKNLKNGAYNLHYNGISVSVSISTGSNAHAITA